MEKKSNSDKKSTPAKKTAKPRRGVYLPRDNGNHPGGRPPKYNPKYCQDMIDYFSADPHKEVEIISYYKGEVSKIDKKLVANELPAFHKFAAQIGVIHETLIEWTRVYKEFSEAYTRCKELQKFFLIENGLQGTYIAAPFVFVAKNLTDMKDKSETEVNANVKADVGVVYKLPDGTEIPL